MWEKRDDEVNQYTLVLPANGGCLRVWREGDKWAMSAFGRFIGDEVATAEEAKNKCSLEALVLLGRWSTAIISAMPGQDAAQVTTEN